MQYMDDKKKQLKTGFLDPLMISQARYKEVARRHGEEYKDLDDDEFEKAVVGVSDLGGPWTDE
jgi:hypothetical protein